MLDSLGSLFVSMSTQHFILKIPQIVPDWQRRSYGYSNEQYSESGACLPTLQLTTSHSQRLNSGKPLGTSYCEWLWSIATWANRTLPHSGYPKKYRM